ncbi:hypothetical protein B7463_g7402, partial [Scytalidium lignicola]
MASAEPYHINAPQLAQISDVTHLLSQDTKPWYQKRNLRKLYLTLVPAALGVEMTSGYDGSVLNGLQAVVPWNDYFNNPNGALLGLITAAFSIVAMFLVSRLMLGYGIPYAISGASQLIAELSHPKERAVITGLFNESWFVPESPRWLISKDRAEEAFEILVKYHAEGDPNDTFVLAEFQQIRETISMEAEASKSSWVELFKTRSNLHRLLIAACVGLFSQWSGNGLVSYYLSKVLKSIGIQSSRTQNQINVALQCWNLITGVGGAFATKFIVRRTQYMLSFSGMTIVFACWTAASARYSETGNTYAAGAVVGMIFVYYMCYNLMMPLTYIYITETFPFISRSKGVAITQGFSRAGSAFNLFVNPIGLESLAWKYYLVYIAWLGCETILIFLAYPETKGPTLEEMALVFEGKSAKVGLINVSEKVDATLVQQVEKV